MRLRLVLLFSLLAASLPGQMQSIFSKSDFDLTADQQSKHWKSIPPVAAEKTNLGVVTPNHRTEIRSRWTKDNIYFLFTCPFEELFLIPDPKTTQETNKLWEHDAAEVFIGGDFTNIHQYREYQVSPQGEWVDLNIDTKQALPEGGWLWNSGFTVKARIDKAKKVWYGEMKIPLKSITDKQLQAGDKLRVNHYRFQGPGPKRKSVAWLPTGRPSNHTPEAFGTLTLVK